MFNKPYCKGEKGIKPKNILALLPVTAAVAA